MFDYHLALHGLAIRKTGDAADVAALVGLDPAVAQKALDWAEAGRRVAKAGDKYMLTAPAQMALRMEYSRFYGDLRANAAMLAAYDQFETINNELKRLITDWQTVEVGGDRIANDHANTEYDRRIIDRLGGLHERFEPVLKRMAAEVPRLAIHGDLLLAALEKAEDGDIRWVSDATIASYHTVWFEMHEDLLRILGKVRDE